MADRIQHTYVSLPSPYKSFALMSEAPPDTVKRAVVFIHGFNGSARKTWTDFLSLVDDREACSDWWEQSDLYFFHYQWASVFHQLVNNTLAIYRFIQSIYPSPANVLVKGNAYREATFQYEELVLVGHSEGGLLLRKAILEAAQRDKSVQAFMQASKHQKATQPTPSGMLSASMRLFAPALGGEMQTGLLGILTSLPIVSHALSASAARKGMNPSSAAVTEARRQTDHYADNLDFGSFKAHIVWAARDTVVSGEKYEKDEHCLNLPPGTNHSSVCKPTVQYSLPLDFVELGVNQYACQQ